MKVFKIVSGGQTGADRGGLDAAIECGDSGRPGNSRRNPILTGGEQMPCVRCQAEIPGGDAYCPDCRYGGQPETPAQPGDVPIPADRCACGALKHSGETDCLRCRFPGVIAAAGASDAQRERHALRRCGRSGYDRERRKGNMNYFIPCSSQCVYESEDRNGNFLCLSIEKPRKDVRFLNCTFAKPAPDTLWKRFKRWLRERS